MITIDNQGERGNISDSNQAREFFEKVQKVKFTGKITFTSISFHTWDFYFYFGRVIYATGGENQVRRFFRNIYVHFPQVRSRLINLIKNPEVLQKQDLEIGWEYELLRRWIHQKQISAEQFQKFVIAQIEEILFDIFHSLRLSVESQPHKFSTKILTIVSLETIISTATEQEKAWQEAKLFDRSPNHGLKIIKSQELTEILSPKVLTQMQSKFTGNKSLRDISLQSQLSLLKLTKSLQPYLQIGLIELVAIPDLKPPIKVITTNTVTTKVPLVACVDDSSTVCKTLKKIVKGQGYDFISTTDDLRSLNLFLNHKPDLIFIDFYMPNLNGYELCRILRKSHNEKLKNIPIVLLTSYKNILEHFRGKINGCNDLLFKPIDPDAIREILHKYLGCG